MADKKCLKCGKVHEGKCKTKKGSYGLGPEEIEDDLLDDEITVTGAEEGSMNERTEFNVDLDMKGMSDEKKQSALEKFRKNAAEAKKRKEYKDNNDKLRSETRAKGIRFYDSKGSGYIRKGKKHYD
jgi:hypothetical protein